MIFITRIIQAFGLGGRADGFPGGATSVEGLRTPILCLGNSQLSELTGGHPAAAPHIKALGILRCSAPATRVDLRQLHGEGAKIENLISQNRILKRMGGKANFSVTLLTSYRLKSDIMLEYFRGNGNKDMVKKLTTERQTLCKGLPEHLRCHLTFKRELVS